MNAHRLRPGACSLILASFLAVLLVSTALAEPSLGDDELRSKAPPPLSSVPVPNSPNIGDFIADQSTAVVLGKALFWDMQVGSDGIQACASCHYQAGEDIRAKNQLAPGPDGEFDETATGGYGPNYTLVAADFPFPKEFDDVAGSQGVFSYDFEAIKVGKWIEVLKQQVDPTFQVGGVQVRQVTGRNSPSPVNAVFNYRQFWDGRANAVFNGVNPHGPRDPDAAIWVLAGKQVKKQKVEIYDASLASQAVGPCLNPVEMSGTGRSFPELGRKLLNLRPLGRQQVDQDDSVLGSLRYEKGKGLSTSYGELIKKAFKSKYWAAQGTVDGTFTQMEANFSLFWGLAVAAYEGTLISDQTRYDTWAAGDNDALTSQEKWGLELFLDKGKCINCHGQAEFTNAGNTVRKETAVNRMVMGNGEAKVYDEGFYNVGVRPTSDDLGVGAYDPWGNPLSYARQLIRRLSDPDAFVDVFKVDSSKFEVDPGVDVHEGDVASADGAFKVPGLRNVELRGPYFHNGGKATLDQVVEFYDDGGDFADLNRADLDPDIQMLGFSEDEIAAVVAFLKSLTDERVRWERAPFDHPEILIPDGHPGDHLVVVDSDGDGYADDALRELPAVGKGGRSAALGPLKAFLE